MSASGSRLVRLSAGGCLAAALLLAAAAWSVDPQELPDPAMQARYQHLIHELRCVQCQNESLADSEVNVAGDVRRQVREMMLAGKSDDQIRDYLVARYSEFILFKPKYSWRNAWLWLAPFVLIGIGIAVAARIIRGRAALLATDTEIVDEDSPDAPR
ncbi:MAG TPA: cytochrome c-type biogenesis protein [Steroidobacteraceae bacterium]|nr:cytochrome c-type biogenesis protein [Steroidobacteraceae bacterium]